MHLRPLVLRLAALMATCALILSTAGTGAAKPAKLPDRTEPTPKRLQGIDVEEHLNTSLPKQLAFKDEQGNDVMLGDYFKGDVPVIVTLNYSDCPMLCSLQLSGLVKSLKGVEWTASKEFRMVTVSLDPNERPSRALETQTRYVRDYQRPEAKHGWHFLTGSEANIKAVAKAIGFKYGYNEVRKEYVHPAAFVIATPDGKIARYHYGIEYEPKTLRLSLVEASEGKIGTTVDRLILYCFHYDASEGKYAPVAMNIMRLGGGLTALLLGGALSIFWMRELRNKKKKASRDPDSPSDSLEADSPLGLNPTQPTTSET